MSLYSYFRKCIELPYIEVEQCASFATERQGEHLTVYFEPSAGAMDWRNNLDFPARVYGDWFAHRGFVRVWCAAEEYLAPQLRDPAVRSLRVVGYSHGAALAVLCHEFAWYHRPDLRQQMEGYGFGCPRVVWGSPPKERWERFTVVRVRGDAVTRLPPAWLGYTHVGRLLELGTAGDYNGTDAHRPETYLKELKRAEC